MLNFSNVRLARSNMAEKNKTPPQSKEPAGPPVHDTPAQTVPANGDFSIPDPDLDIRNQPFRRGAVRPAHE